MKFSSQAHSGMHIFNPSKTNKQLIIKTNIQSINTLLSCLSFPKYFCKILLSMPSDFIEEHLSMLYRTAANDSLTKASETSVKHGVQKESEIKARHGSAHL